MTAVHRWHRQSPFAFWFFSTVLAVLLLLVLAGLPRDALDVRLESLFAPPLSAQLPLGADELGRDILARLAQGMGVSIFVGVSVFVLAGSIGTLIGVISGWCGGWIDTILMRITDVFLAFPGILIAICFAALTRPGVENVILALGFMGWVSFARLARVQTLYVKQQAYITSARALGVPPFHIVHRHVLPNIMAPLLVESIFTIAGAMIAEAGLSFLGIGIQPPDPSLGTMLREGARYMLVAPHLVLAPGLVLMGMVLTLSLLGDRVRDVLDVRAGDARETAVKK